MTTGPARDGWAQDENCARNGARNGARPGDEGRDRRRRRGGAAGPIVLVLLLATVVLVTVPGAVGLSDTTPLAHAVAVRGLAALLLVALGLPVAIGVLVRSLRRKRALRAVLAGVLALACLGGADYDLAVLEDRGLARTLGKPVPEIGLEPSADHVRLVAFNTLHADDEAITDLIVRHHANVVVLPETSLDQGRRVAEAAATELSAQVADTGLAPALAVSEYQVFSSGAAEGLPDGHDGTTVLLAAAELGTYRQDTTAELSWGDVRAVPEDPADPILYGVHTAWPNPLDMERWRDDVDRASGYCAAESSTAAATLSDVGAVVAGDFNATPDHAPLDLAPCRSALSSSQVTGELAGEGTWPSFLPSVLGAAIDHVVVDPDHWQTFSARLESVDGSDHRAVTAVLTPAGPAGTGPGSAGGSADPAEGATT